MTTSAPDAGGDERALDAARGLAANRRDEAFGAVVAAAVGALAHGPFV